MNVYNFSSDNTKGAASVQAKIQAAKKANLNDALSRETTAEVNRFFGRKGAGLFIMSSLNLPVPPGFVIPIYMQHKYEASGLTTEFKNEVQQALKKLAHLTGKVWDDPSHSVSSHSDKAGNSKAYKSTQGLPLLVSVRSGAAMSMPGMMDSILNLGLNDSTTQILAQHSSPEFAWGTYARFIKSYAKIVHNLSGEVFNSITPPQSSSAQEASTPSPSNQSPTELQSYVQKIKQIFHTQMGFEFPQKPCDQLWPAIAAVFKSWHSPRAQAYRRLHHLPQTKVTTKHGKGSTPKGGTPINSTPIGGTPIGGTAVTVQAMVFGNLGSQSATGVAFTRNPSTGEKQIYGEFLACAQGEDIVSGTRTPEPIQNLQKLMPTAYAELKTLFTQLEQYYEDVQDVEFTIEQGRVWLLQTRRGQRSLLASLNIATDMVNEKLITPAQALQRIEANNLVQLFHPQLQPSKKDICLAQGLPASPGAAVGAIVFSAQEAKKQARKARDVILVRFETSPEDIEGLVAAKAVLTACGGMTSHAAVVARGMGKPCIVGCQELNIDQKQLKIICKKTSTTPAQTHTLKSGDVISLDGSTGQIFLGPVATSPAPPLPPAYKKIMQWAQTKRRLKVRANADTPQEAAKASQLGAEGIGLCRTEHMFFAPERLIEMQKLILAGQSNEGQQALQALLPFQREDFRALFQAMQGQPVCIRLLDPPLHEFLPRTEHELQKLAEALGLSLHMLQQRAQSLKEQNPMLGHRGCRLALSTPEIYKMQTQAILEATSSVATSGVATNSVATNGAATSSVVTGDVATSGDTTPCVEIMIPFVCDKNEWLYVRNLVLEQLGPAANKFSIGAMIELPRAALLANEIAEAADFLSFGTNDLTQTVFGFSRDDVGRFLNFYTERGYFADPFARLDTRGLGQLLRIAVNLARDSKPNIKLGVCGEHAGEAKSVHFFHRLGLDYISCSPHRIPIATLAAAQH